MLVLFGLVLYALAAGVLLVFIAAFSWDSFADYRRRRALVCPETKDKVDVEVDARHAWKTTLQGRPHLRLRTCSRWPERYPCDEDCLAQVKATPDLLELVLAKWHQGRCCALCAKPLVKNDWQGGRVGLLHRGALLELRDLRLEDIFFVLEGCTALCWQCHQNRRAAAPARLLLPGDRRHFQQPIWDWVNS